MSLQATEPRQHMSTLTNGWRFTLPTPIRKLRGWDTGTRLLARIEGTTLVLSADDASTKVAAVGDIDGSDGLSAQSAVSMSDRPDRSDVSGSSPMRTRGNLANGLDGSAIPTADCYLGSGGKVVLPVSLRSHLNWVIGKRLVIVDGGDGVEITSCCGMKRCRSCGSISGVREIVPNLHLCSQCWDKYLHAMNNKLKWGRAGLR